ncbi:immunity 53 family protein [Adhaeretor mobilis]|uniref:Rhodanese-related sulfurtransferase n=1 Tax=Adhaeretor mobilis TaxID=1930276 RepID=A0A517MSE1_9BACT|nr:immunity 53 family protein [Adhaeretor mobilis]QDS97788.1 hypothetical protein HG15A2_10550 [Adhaeretor mobilis]
MVLDRLQRWYHDQCDEDWEHQYGVKIDTLDNPGWSVNIDLIGTSLETKPFAELRENLDDDDCQQSDRWMHCRVANKVWIGFGDETKLERLLKTFLSWAESDGS